MTARKKEVQYLRLVPLTSNITILMMCCQSKLLLSMLIPVVILSAVPLVFFSSLEVCRTNIIALGLAVRLSKNKTQFWIFTFELKCLAAQSCGRAAKYCITATFLFSFWILFICILFLHSPLKSVVNFPSLCLGALCSGLLRLRLGENIDLLMLLFFFLSFFFDVVCLFLCPNIFDHRNKMAGRKEKTPDRLKQTLDINLYVIFCVNNSMGHLFQSKQWNGKDNCGRLSKLLLCFYYVCQFLRKKNLPYSANMSH